MKFKGRKGTRLLSGHLYILVEKWTRCQRNSGVNAVRWNV